jgi:hypothetical protein
MRTITMPDAMSDALAVTARCYDIKPEDVAGPGASSPPCVVLLRPAKEVAQLDGLACVRRDAAVVPAE